MEHCHRRKLPHTHTHLWRRVQFALSNAYRHNSCHNPQSQCCYAEDASSKRRQPHDRLQQREGKNTATKNADRATIWQQVGANGSSSCSPCFISPQLALFAYLLLHTTSNGTKSAQYVPALTAIIRNKLHWSPKCGYSCYCGNLRHKSVSFLCLVDSTTLPA